MPTARGLPIPYFTFKGSLVDPRLRASNEHILIVRVPRAGERPGYPTPLFSTLLMRDFLAAQIYFSHALVSLHLLDRAFADDSALVQDCHDTGNLPEKIHVVFDDEDRMFLRERLEQSSGLFRFLVCHAGN